MYLKQIPYSLGKPFADLPIAHECLEELEQFIER